jgi:hypothetical protein
MEHFDLSDWLSAIGYTILSGIGGLLGYVMRENDKGNPLTGLRAAVQGFSSAFVGFLIYLLCRAIGIDSLWVGPIVGVFGWLGATVTIQMLERVVYERLGLKLRENTDRRVAAAQDQEEPL